MFNLKQNEEATYAWGFLHIPFREIWLKQMVMAALAGTIMRMHDTHRRGKIKVTVEWMDDEEIKQ